MTSRDNAHMLTFGVWLYQELFHIVGVDSIRNGLKIFHTHNGTFEVVMSSSRLKLFNRNPVCVNCGLVGEIWCLQADKPIESEDVKRPHLNLYAINQNDQLVLMTQDHIIPKSKGGTNCKDNLQTMCATCNTYKGDKIPPLTYKLGKIYGDIKVFDYERNSYRVARDMAKRSFLNARLRTLSAYAEFLAFSEKCGSQLS